MFAPDVVRSAGARSGAMRPIAATCFTGTVGRLTRCVLSATNATHARHRGQRISSTTMKQRPTRRRFLQSTVAAAGGAMLLSGRSAEAHHRDRLPEPERSGIEHIVVVM